MTRAQEPVAVVGIGAMGHGMATSALRAGIPTIVWNREPDATRDRAKLGAEVAETVAETVRRAAVVITMVPDSDAVISIAGDQGHARGARAGHDLGADEHDRRGRDRARRGPRRTRASDDARTFSLYLSPETAATAIGEHIVIAYDDSIVLVGDCHA